jgi:hypothetical protein
MGAPFAAGLVVEGWQAASANKRLNSTSRRQ